MSFSITAKEPTTVFRCGLTLIANVHCRFVYLTDNGMERLGMKGSQVRLTHFEVIRRAFKGTALSPQMRTTLSVIRKLKGV
jgi:hypothetical protein